MKRILSVILAVLMLLPLGMITASADELTQITVPAEPTATGTQKYYVGWSGAGTKDGTSAENYATTSGWNEGGAFANLVKEGGTVVIVKKCYVDTKSAVFPKTTNPIVFTGVDGDKNYIGTVDNDDKSGQGTQTGMFMIIAGNTTTFMGDVIFDNTYLLDRTNKPNAAKTTTYSVAPGANMVVKDNCVITRSTNGKEDSVQDPKLDVQEGGFAFIHAAGFSEYTGKGTIILDSKIVANVTAESYANFAGVIADETGKVIFDGRNAAPETTVAPETTKAPEQTKGPAETKAPETTKAPTTTKAPETTKAPADTTAAPVEEADNGAIVWIIAGVAAAAVVAVVVVVVIKKKKAE